jgi:hypothetical protein
MVSKTVNWIYAITNIALWRYTITIHGIGSPPLQFYTSLKYTTACLFDAFIMFFRQNCLVLFLLLTSLSCFGRAGRASPCRAAGDVYAHMHHGLGHAHPSSATTLLPTIPGARAPILREAPPSPRCRVRAASPPGHGVRRAAPLRPIRAHVRHGHLAV